MGEPPIPEAPLNLTIRRIKKNHKAISSVGSLNLFMTWVLFIFVPDPQCFPANLPPMPRSWAQQQGEHSKPCPPGPSINPPS